MITEEILKNNRIEDVQWLCSLSESELDIVISLKQLAMRRAKVIGHESLAAKFDLKMLRALSFILMEHLKGELKLSSAISELIKCPNLLDKCKLLGSKVDESFSNMSIEELCAYLGPSKRQRIEKL